LPHLRVNPPHEFQGADGRGCGRHVSGMPAPPSKKTVETPLAKAAAALEGELLEYEKFVAEVKRMSLNTEKAMHRAKDLLEHCASGEQRMAERLQAFAAAMQGVQVRQQTCISEAVAAAETIQGRIQKRSALLERFSALGERARALNEPVAALEEKEGDANAQDLLKTLGEVVARTDAVVSEAETLGADAVADDWQDIAREATTLKQQLQSARNKILTAQRDVAARTPS
jgi:chromosome segregation ATPase